MDVYALGQKPVLFQVRPLDDANPYNPVPISLIGNTRLAVKFYRPDGTTVEKTATATEPLLLTSSPIQYLDTEGILTQAGLWQYTAVIEKIGTVIETTQRILFRVR